MNEQRIREIANQSSTYAENSVDYYSGIVDGLTWEAKILKVRDLKFAELIVFECTRAVMDGTKEGDHYAQRIEQHFDNGTGGVLHFGVEE
jgi:hypothetical protein